MLPTIHPNGTPKDMLSQRLCAVYEALLEANRLLRLAAPNERDYYVAPGTFEPALAQHKRRQDALHALFTEIESDIIAIDAL